MTRSRRGRQAGKELGLERPKKSESAITKRAINRPRKRRVRTFGTLEQSITFSNTRKKRAGDPRRVGRRGNKFRRNCKVNNA